ncbi:unnamed protein product (macronuclear) [Paramecium tetraurelia]|uniref:VTT domain-containing protein n=1 Tax=Paramecium tetraurelia TaxID=5888 RepID=A0BI96_PARTE|nr:uncharacterized protein GSPATT00004635001 [Paramecium tetraurelia]CAK58263.1 unnamed protein product [Paramecium tetraurelia]|eukprot:XP_001425661.1 hypothetical protein (macronuclear) [Paramecium tetraurelia strain d4-2]
MLQQNNPSFQVNTKKIYYFLLAFPFILVGSLICCIYYISGVQLLFLSLFDQCKQISFLGGLNLTMLGVGMILLMMPFALFEFAIAYTCTDYITPILIVTAAKMIGEYASFFIGKELSFFLKELLKEFKFYNAIEKLTQRKPYKTQFLMRMSGVTPQIIMNYGMGVLRTVSFKSFAIVQSVVGFPSTILAVFIGKQFHKIKDIFDSNRSINNEGVLYVEIGIITFAGLSISLLIYYVVREYTKVLKEEVLVDKNENLNKEIDKELSNDMEKTWEDIELQSAI